MVCQVRHDRNLAVGDARLALEIRNDLAEATGEVLNLEQHTQQEIGFAVGPSGMVPVQPEAQQAGWRLRSASGSWVVALLPDFFALESTGYTSWTDFQERLNALCEAVSRHLRPVIEMRLGLRYVDRIELPEIDDPVGWRGRIDPQILGPVLHEAIGPSVSASQQILQLLAPGELRVILRHGSQKEGDAWPYILDTDCFREGARPFLTEEVMLAAQELHRLSLQVFQASISRELFEQLQDGTDLDAS